MEKYRKSGYHPHAFPDYLSVMPNASFLKQTNIGKVKRSLLELGEATKAEIAASTGLTTVTCGTILNELVSSGTVTESGEARPSCGGRPAQVYRYAPRANMFICMYTLSEAGRETLHSRVTDVLGTDYETAVEERQNLDVPCLIRKAQKWIQKYPLVRAVIVGIQGCVGDGAVEFSDISAFDGVNVTAEMSSALGIPVYLENDMNAIALGFSRENQNEKNVTILFFPKGNPPGAGFLVDGNILRGSSNLAGELSRLPFGYSVKEQTKLFSSLKSSFPMLVRIVVTTIVYLDPAVIVFTGNLAGELSPQKLSAAVERSLQRKKSPRFIFRPDTQKEYFDGLSAIALRHLL